VSCLSLANLSLSVESKANFDSSLLQVPFVTYVHITLGFNPCTEIWEWPLDVRLPQAP
jgi:hypothetical protein